MSSIIVLAVVCNIEQINTSSLMVNPLRSRMFEDPEGYGEGLKSPPPSRILKAMGSILTISCMCILHGVSHMFQLDFFSKICDFDHFTALSK